MGKRDIATSLLDIGAKKFCSNCQNRKTDKNDDKEYGKISTKIFATSLQHPTSPIPPNMPPPKRPGTGAKAAALVRFVHPGKPFRDAYGELEYQRKKLSNFLVVGTSFEKVSSRSAATNCLHLRHDDFPDQLFKVSRHRCTITEEGPEEGLFVFAPSSGGRADTTARPESSAAASVVPGVGNFASITNVSAEDISVLRHNGIMVDDDNDPSPDNIPADDDAPPPSLNLRTNNICPRRASGNPSPDRGNFHNHTWAAIKNMSDLEILLELCLPKKYIINVVVPETNKRLSTPMDFGE